MKRILGFVLLSLSLTIRVTPQTPTSVQGKEGQFTLKTSTEIVLVNVTVRDKDGNFIRDLKQSDFSVLEDGKPQSIVSLDVENTDAVVGNNEIQAANLLGTLNAKASTTTKAATPAPSATEPITKETFRDRRLIVLFFDLSSMQPEEIKRASEAAQNYINKQMRPADMVAVVTLMNTLDTV